MKDWFPARWRHLQQVERRRIASQPSYLRLGRLERPEPWERTLLDEIRATMPLDCVQQYPDYPPFYEELAEFVGVRANQLVVGWGIEGLVRDLYMICCEPGDGVAMLWPTCKMFEVYAEAFGLEAVRLATDPDKPSLRPSQVVGWLPPHVRLLLLPNPGQPVETCFDPDQLRVIAAGCAERRIVLAIDEAYHGFGGPSALPLVEEFDNVVVLRTFSKAFGAAGIRLGYAVAGPMLHRALDAVRPSGEAASLSMHVASVLMRRHANVVAPGIAEVCAGRDWLRDEIRTELGLRAWGSVANHVLVELQSDLAAQRAWRRLAEMGVHVKAPYAHPLDRHLLITCGRRALMEKFFAAFRAALYEAEPLS